MYYTTYKVIHITYKNRHFYFLLKYSYVPGVKANQDAKHLFCSVLVFRLKKKIFLSDPEIQEPARFVHVTDRALIGHLTWKKKG